MSLIRINLTDHSQTISEEVHGSVAQAIVAALSADPENLSELQLAVNRFSAGEDFSWYAKYANYEPFDAGILIVDLAARIVAGESSYCDMVPQGEIRFHDGDSMTDVPIRYWMADEWKFIRSVDEYRNIAPVCRAARDGVRRTDYRDILYGRELCQFLIDNYRPDDISEIHANWLMFRRDDLDGKSPREVMLESRDRVDFDLYSRELQWSFTGICPPLIPINSNAFRFAGFGTHEWVVYYDLVRHLLRNFTPDIDRMEEMKTVWLETPDHDSMGRVPIEIIESERRRQPLEATMAEMVFDDDCPICRMMREEFDTPTFMHLDGCEMDDRFEFSYFKTIEEWQEDQRRFEEFDRKFKAGELEEEDDEGSLILEEDLIFD